MSNGTATPLYEDIEKTLREEISTGKYKAHERFLSEVKLSEHFGVNAATARKAVDRLVIDGLLYKVPSSGTYISPRRKNKMILIVIPHHSHSLISYVSIEEFIGTPYRFQEVHAVEYNKHVEDIQLIYPELVGIIFYRDDPGVSHTFPLLNDMGIPFIFYGSSTHKHSFKKYATFFYSENTIAQTAMNHLSCKGCKNIGIVYRSKWPSSVERFRQYLRWMKAQNKTPDPDLILDADLMSATPLGDCYQELLAALQQGLLAQADGMFCAGDDLAATLVQAAKEAGIQIPEQLKVIGVNNDNICEIIHPQMSSVDLPVAEDSRLIANALIRMIEGDEATPKLRSNITVVERQTT